MSSYFLLLPFFQFRDNAWHLEARQAAGEGSGRPESGKSVTGTVPLLLWGTPALSGILTALKDRGISCHDTKVRVSFPAAALRNAIHVIILIVKFENNILNGFPLSSLYTKLNQMCIVSA